MREARGRGARGGGDGGEPGGEEGVRGHAGEEGGEEVLDGGGGALEELGEEVAAGETVGFGGSPRLRSETWGTRMGGGEGLSGCGWGEGVGDLRLRDARRARIAALRTDRSKYRCAQDDRFLPQHGS